MGGSYPPDSPTLEPTTIDALAPTVQSYTLYIIYARVVSKKNGVGLPNEPYTYNQKVEEYAK